MIRNPMIWHGRRAAARELARLRQELEELAVHSDPVAREYYWEVEAEYVEAERLLRTIQEGRPRDQYEAAEQAMAL